MPERFNSTSAPKMPVGHLVPGGAHYVTSPPMIAIFVCSICGAAVVFPPIHDEWHKEHSGRGGEA